MTNIGTQEHVGALRVAGATVGHKGPDRRRLRIVHVEVGGAYGGSVRALELYLAYSDPTHFEHEVLFYFPTAGEDRLKPWVKEVRTLYPGLITSAAAECSSLKRMMRTILGASKLRAALSEVRACLQIAASQPAIAKLARLLRRGGYDAVHVNNTFAYQPLTLLAAWAAGIPIISHVRNPVPSTLLNRFLMRRSRCIVTVNRVFEQELRAWGTGVAIHACRDGLALTSPDNDASMRVRASLLERGGVLIGSAGRLDPQKGYETLVEAAQLVLREHPDVHFAIAGDGPLYASLSQLISKLSVQANVHLCGFVPDIENFLASLDLFVNSSNWEGLPLALMEAMLLGKPVVATDVGGNAEVVESGVAGEIVPAGNPTRLAEAISNSIRNLALVSEKARQSPLAIAKLTDPTQAARNFDKFIDLSLANSRRIQAARREN